MSNKTKFVSLAAIAMALLLAGCGPEIMPPPLPTDTHVHKWGKWSAPEITSDWYHGTQQWQTRKCDVCGLAESRVVLISPSAKGSPKKDSAP